MKFLFTIILLGLLICLIINIPFSNKYITAIFGLIGVLVGTLASTIGNIIFHEYKERSNKELQVLQMDMLREMLNKNPDGWRKLLTLSSVIGATENEARRLLIKIKARASETKRKDKDGNDVEVWGFLKNHPLPAD